MAKTARTAFSIGPVSGRPNATTSPIVRNVITTSRTIRTTRSSISQVYANGLGESSASHNPELERATTRPNDPRRPSQGCRTAFSCVCNDLSAVSGGLVRVMSGFGDVGGPPLPEAPPTRCPGRTQYSTAWQAGVRCCPDGARSLAVLRRSNASRVCQAICRRRPRGTVTRTCARGTSSAGGVRMRSRAPAAEALLPTGGERILGIRACARR